MIIREQKLKNFDRIYYHGKVAGFKKEERKFSEFYLTTNIYYAVMYAKRGGTVEKYQLKEIADIFNANSHTDERIFRDYCIEHNNIAYKYLTHLKNCDWCGIDDDKYRDKLIDIVKELGYDGFFNYELDENLRRVFHNAGVFQFDGKEPRYPAIGLFNEDMVTKKAEYKIEDIIQIENEKSCVVSDVILALSKNINLSAEDFLKREYQKTFVVSKKDILDIFNSYPRKSIIRRNRYLQKRAEEKLKQFYKDYFKDN